MANYTFGLSFTNCLPHLKGKEVFGSSNWPVDSPLNVDNDSHHTNRVNFFCPQVIFPIVEPNVVDDVHMQQLPFSSSKLLLLVFQGGLELKENICAVI